MNQKYFTTANYEGRPHLWKYFIKSIMFKIGGIDIYLSNKNDFEIVVHYSYLNSMNGAMEVGQN